MSQSIDFKAFHEQLVREAATAADKLAKFEAFLQSIGASTGTTAPAAQAAPKKEAPAKRGRPAKAVTTPTTKASYQEKAKAGRNAVARGDRPALKDAIHQIMGSDTINAEEVYQRLVQKGWLPNSSDPKNYIRYTLSSNRTWFDRVPGQRGYYRAAKVNGNAGTVKVAPEAKETPKRGRQVKAAETPEAAPVKRRGRAPKAATTAAAPVVTTNTDTPAKRRGRLPKAVQTTATAEPMSAADQALADLGLDPARDASPYAG